MGWILKFTLTHDMLVSSRALWRYQICPPYQNILHNFHIIYWQQYFQNESLLWNLVDKLLVTFCILLQMHSLSDSTQDFSLPLCVMSMTLRGRMFYSENVLLHFIWWSAITKGFSVVLSYSVTLFSSLPLSHSPVYDITNETKRPTESFRFFDLQQSIPSPKFS
jgi:hypothetical protein